LCGRVGEIENPVLDKNSIDEISKLVKEAFEVKDEKKKLIKEIKQEIDNYFKIWQKIADLVRKSHEARKKAKELLEKAKQKVEEMISTGTH